MFALFPCERPPLCKSRFMQVGHMFGTWLRWVLRAGKFVVTFISLFQPLFILATTTTTKVHTSPASSRFFFCDPGIYNLRNDPSVINPHRPHTTCHGEGYCGRFLHWRHEYLSSRVLASSFLISLQMCRSSLWTLRYYEVMLFSTSEFFASAYVRVRH